MALKSAGDIMIPLEKYPHIPYWFSLRQAVAEIENSEIDVDGRTSLPRALLVFDEKYELLGIARRRDILRGLQPDLGSHQNGRKLFDVEFDADLLEVSPEKSIRDMKESADRTVEEVMQPIVAAVRFDDHLTKVIYIILKHDLSLLPVLKNDKVVGVVRSVDVFHHVAKEIL
jgi:CBS-domain-containing membrane protein